MATTTKPRPTDAKRTTTRPAAAKPAAASKKPAAARKPASAAWERLSVEDVMAELQAAGSEQTRKTYARHGATAPMFGVSFATLKAMVKRIRVDHDLALVLWKTGNLDARTLAIKVADPARIGAAELDAWAKAPAWGMGSTYVAQLASESPHARKKAEAWLSAASEQLRTTGWQLVGAMALTDEVTPDAWFASRLAEIEEGIQDAPNAQRSAMNRTLIALGCRSPALRKSAVAAAKRIGAVDVDHGDTDCKTPDAAASIEKAWAHSLSKGFASPAAHERSREPMRLRC